MVEDAKFWVVRPRISLSGISGLSHAAVRQLHRLRGRRVAEEASGRSPAWRCRRSSPAAAAGTQFTLNAADLGSLGIGSPVYYRRLPVGQVVAFDLVRRRQVGDGPGLRQRALRQVRGRGHALLERERLRRVADRQRPRRAHAVARRAAGRRRRVRHAAVGHACRRRVAASASYRALSRPRDGDEAGRGHRDALRALLRRVAARPLRRRAGHVLRRAGRRGHRRRACVHREDARRAPARRHRRLSASG